MNTTQKSTDRSGDPMHPWRLISAAAERLMFYRLTCAVNQIDQATFRELFEAGDRDAVMVGRLRNLAHWMENHVEMDPDDLPYAYDGVAAAPIKPRARIITDMGEPFWIVFAGPAYHGSGRCGIEGDNSLEGAYQSWQVYSAAKLGAINTLQTGDPAS